MKNLSLLLIIFSFGAQADEIFNCTAQISQEWFNQNLSSSMVLAKTKFTVKNHERFQLNKNDFQIQNQEELGYPELKIKALNTFDGSKLEYFSIQGTVHQNIQAVNMSSATDYIDGTLEIGDIEVQATGYHDLESKKLFAGAGIFDKKTQSEFGFSVECVKQKAQ